MALLVVFDLNKTLVLKHLGLSFLLPDFTRDGKAMTNKARRPAAGKVNITLKQAETHNLLISSA